MKRNRKSVTVATDSSVQEMLELLRLYPQTAAKALLEGANEGAQQLLAKALKERFKGQGPFPIARRKLGHRSGRLSETLRATQARIKAGLVTLSMGSNVKYFGVHEFGSKGQERVKAHHVREHKVRNAFGRGRQETRAAHTRKAHLRQNNYAGRQPLQTALKMHGTRVFGIAMERRLKKALEGMAR